MLTFRICYQQAEIVQLKCHIVLFMRKLSAPQTNYTIIYLEKLTAVEIVKNFRLLYGALFYPFLIK